MVGEIEKWMLNRSGLPCFPFNLILNRAAAYYLLKLAKKKSLLASHSDFQKIFHSSYNVLKIYGFCEWKKKKKVRWSKIKAIFFQKSIDFYYNRCYIYCENIFLYVKSRLIYSTPHVCRMPHKQFITENWSFSCSSEINFISV